MVDQTQQKARKLYLDVHGVILRQSATRARDGLNEYEIHPSAVSFLEWCLEKFECFWLTSLARDGDYQELERAVRHALPAWSLPPNWRDIIHAIKPASWARLKTDGIDLGSDFYWVDDNPQNEAVTTLRWLGLETRLVTVSPNRQNDHLTALPAQISALEKLRGSKN